jgi:hypothetical protein
MTDAALARSRADRCARPATTECRTNESRLGSASDARAARGASRFAQYATSRTLSAASAGFGAALAIAILFGWLSRDEGYLAPDSGAGYWLGIAGASAMLLLLLYPLRKRLRSLRAIGSVSLWFRLHMILGLLGPALILLHSNFRLGSLNSNVAMVAMLIVAASGIIGRFLYRRIHLGLYGRKAELQGLLADAETLKRLAADGLPVGNHIIEQLSGFTTYAMRARAGVLASLCLLPVLGVRARLLRYRLRRDVRRLLRIEGKRRGWSRRARTRRFDAVAEIVTLQLAAVRKAAAFEFYDRLFGLWHVLHLPLFVILVLAAGVHVVAAHFY